ncbi:glucuronate isomerase [Bifidobacterium stellenboschense]|uniref:Uronate isomerase n=1 Tax=Bifidobacterium stellenboschense TaxID=762211 RepID=A0A087DIS6_9BIFI|nr:glucuronate isomerase [Bifidobacterium stellenboschense]KFI95426.1 glucuronate isomerase [Bifidobacterium stellenboschense]
MKKFILDDGRLLSGDHDIEGIAKDLYEEVRDLPIISPHGHVPVAWFAQDLHFANPTSLFITPDHYVTRVLHSQGVPLSALGVNRTDYTDDEARKAFLLLGEHWNAFAGTPMRYWFEDALQRVFGIDEKFGPDTAGRIYDEFDELLASDEFTTRELAKRFNIEFISTTDDPVDDLALHDKVNADEDFPARVAPCFRPDKYLEPARADWPELAAALGAAADVDTTTYEGFHEAMRRRRLYFKEHGAVASDHSHADAGTARLTEEEARTLYAKALKESIDPDDATRLRRHFVNDQARLAQDDGLVMTIHPAVYRNYDHRNFVEYGPDTGADIPDKVDFAAGLRPLLNEYGNNPDFHFVAFTMDETEYSRSLGPLAGFYPALYVGAPWWFIDAPEPILHYFQSTVVAAGFTKLSGFIDDTRALCSIPSRHDMNRRLTARFVAGFVADHRLSLDEGRDIVRAAVRDQPRKVFKLD